jgi:hypothetical protein
MPVVSKQNIILIKTPSGEYEAWSDLKASCIAHGWAYYALAKKTLPAVTKDGCIIHRIFVQ